MKVTTRKPPAAAAPKKGEVREFLSRLFREKKLGAAGMIIVLLFLLVGIFADFLAPTGMLDFDVKKRLQGPSAEHPLGTDHNGRDVLTRIIYGARISMTVGVTACAIALVIAATFGLLSGYFSGAFDLVVQRIVDSWLSFPPLFIILTVMSILGPGVIQTIVVLGAFWGIANIRTVRGMVLSTKENVYVEAARAVGCPTWRILIRHILPHIVAPIIVVFTVSLAGIIISEATISFLGYGIPPPQPSWGGMLSLEGRKYMLQAPGLAFWPGLCLAIVAYGINMFGDALRDLLDPRLRGGAGRYGRVKGKK
jgi:peptide/nickel transport system permease protein